MSVGSPTLESAPPPQYPVTEANRSFTTVTTSEEFLVQAELVWDAILFYEEITDSPPFALGRFLPKPIGAAGCKFEVGGEVKCHYTGGHLIKRIIQLTPPQKYVFEIIEQDLALSGIRLLGGDYTLFQISPGRTRVALTTRYVSSNRPQWFYRLIESSVCHSFHRYILRAIRRKLSGRIRLKN